MDMDIFYRINIRLGSPKISTSKYDIMFTVTSYFQDSTFHLHMDIKKI